MHKTGDKETTVIRRQGGKGKGIYGRQWGTVGGCGGNGRIDENRESRIYKEKREIGEGSRTKKDREKGCRT